MIRHPDKNPGDNEANEKYIEISNAYEVLSDDSKKRHYDQYGSEPTSPPPRNSQSGFHFEFSFGKPFNFHADNFNEVTRYQKKHLFFHRDNFKQKLLFSPSIILNN